MVYHTSRNRLFFGLPPTFRRFFKILLSRDIWVNLDEKQSILRRIVNSEPFITIILQNREICIVFSLKIKKIRNAVFSPRMRRKKAWSQISDLRGDFEKNRRKKSQTVFPLVDDLS